MGNFSEKIYSSRKDHGQTQLLSGERVSKDHERMKACGSLDELQSHLGLARCFNRQEPIQSILSAVQADILVAGSELASTSSTKAQLKRRIREEDTRRLEAWIDDLTASFGLPEHFVLPGRSTDSASLHVARAVARRCERIIVTLNRKAGGFDKLLVYFNRLSDLLFVAAWSREVMADLEEMVRESIVSGMAEGNDR